MKKAAKKEKTIRTDQQKQEVKAMYDDGWNPEDIADELGYDETEVIEYCSEI